MLRLVRTSCMQWSVSPPQPPPAANGGQLQPHSLPTGHPLTTTCPPVRFTVDFCPQLDNLLPPSPSPCGHPANQYPLVIPIKSRRSTIIRWCLCPGWIRTISPPRRHNVRHLTFHPSPIVWRSMLNEPCVCDWSKPDSQRMELVDK